MPTRTSQTQLRQLGAWRRAFVDLDDDRAPAMSNPILGYDSAHPAVVDASTDASVSVSTSLSSAPHARRWTIQSFTRVQVTRPFRQWSTLQSALLLSPIYVDGQRSVRSSHKSSQGSAPYCVVLRGRSCTWGRQLFVRRLVLLTSTGPYVGAAPRK